MKKMINLWKNWMTGKEKVSMVMLIVSCIISSSLVGIIARTLAWNWNALPAVAIGWLIFLAATQLATLVYGAYSLVKFVSDRQWYIYWYEQMRSDKKVKES